MLPSNESKYWSYDEKSLLQQVNSTLQGITETEADERLAQYGPNKLQAGSRSGAFILFLKQFNSPITLILIGAAILSFFLGDRTNALIILAIIFISASLSFFQEKGAADALKELVKLVQITTTVFRDGHEKNIPIEQVVKGDIAILSAGDTVPGDCRLMEANNLFLNEAALTGETFPSEKKCCTLAPTTALANRINCIFMGTHVISGTAKAIVVDTARDTEFGKISQHLRKLKPETEFEKEIKHFGYLLMEITVMLVVLVFIINISLHKPIIDSFLFSLAIAVGLTPQLLPAIISINLSKGASRMARQKVIVKRLSAIENFGSMDVLCCDKTGTLTQGKITLQQAIDFEGNENKKAFETAYINAFLESGFTNPIDSAIRNYGNPDMSGIRKLAEIPYDFVRKRLSILASAGNENILITKGAFHEMLGICNKAEDSGGNIVDIHDINERLEKQFALKSAEGFRIISVAYKNVPCSKNDLDKDDETGMIFLGMLLLTDPPKPDAAATLQRLNKMGVALKIITGDNPLIATYISKQVGIDNPVIITGEELIDMSSEALIQKAPQTNVFAAVEPNQKERILIALKRAGKVVGFMGDGINDAPALHTADVGISVNGAADVAKDAADIVLLSDNLDVLENGITEGRKTFANTLKYIFMATSANFGNMFSMAGSSLLLPFLPLLPTQVLLVNLLTDIPEMTIATDDVDINMIEKPSKMHIGFIKKFMVVFGIISSLFDYITFAVLLYVIKAPMREFRTGWFIESVISAALIVLIIRTSQSVFKSRPGKYLAIATMLVIIATLIIPLSPIAPLLGFSRMPFKLYLWIAVIILTYMALTEITKRVFYKFTR
ncbi:MAG TPA: magnesium-translocating P-type ATPase [Puia sp.]|nr:magnesium-translocating P-type ATPase [Puia sp.]